MPSIVRTACVVLLLLPLLAATAAEDAAAATRESRRRPSRPSLAVSDRVLPLPLVDALDDGFHVPRRKQLRVPALRAILGDDFDPFWMSVDEPTVTVQRETVAGPPSERLASQLRALDPDPAVDGAVRDWLLRKASCPVRYVWDDVGPLFWPRWVKRGECVDDPRGRPCSWPAGMHCVPAESVTFHLLRWHCRPRRAGTLDRRDPRHQRCQWLKVPYPVTARCLCSC